MGLQRTRVSVHSRLGQRTDLLDEEVGRVVPEHQHRSSLPATTPKSSPCPDDPEQHLGHPLCLGLARRVVSCSLSSRHHPLDRRTGPFLERRRRQIKVLPKHHDILVRPRLELRELDAMLRPALFGVKECLEKLKPLEDNLDLVAGSRRCGGRPVREWRNEKGDQVLKDPVPELELEVEAGGGGEGIGEGRELGISAIHETDLRWY